MEIERSQNAATYGALHQKPLAGIKQKIYKTPYEAAQRLNIPLRTSRTGNGITWNHVKRHEKCSRISLTPEEQALERWITQISRSGYPARHSTIREMAEAIRLQCVRNDSIELVSCPVMYRL
jgi:hypothetical protein